MFRQGIQHYALGKDQTTASRKINNEEEVKEDRTHTEETSNKHHTTSTYMEPPTEEKNRKEETPDREKHLAGRNTWPGDTDNESKKMGYTGREMEKMTTNRQEQRSLVDGL